MCDVSYYPCVFLYLDLPLLEFCLLPILTYPYLRISYGGGYIVERDHSRWIYMKVMS